MLYEKVYNFIKDNALIQNADTVICAVSGGADSVCLLDIFINLREKLGVSIECAHLNHNLRGGESDGDEQYVRDLCERFSIPFHCKSVDVLSMSEGASLEDTARQARYDFFKEISASRNVLIATAHTQNDNVETFFINLARGSGGRGLCGIPTVRGNIIRPLLGVTRDEIIAHLDSAGLSFRTDSTNSDTAYLRNFIRHDILPEFKKRDGLDIFKSVSRAISNLKLDCDALDSIAKKSDTDDVKTLLSLPDALLYRVVNAKLEREFDIILDSVHFNAIKKVLEKSCRKELIRDGVYAKNRYGKLVFEKETVINTECKILELGDNYLGGKNILIKKCQEIYKALTNIVIDCDKITGSLYATPRREGDEFYCPYRKCTAKLKKLLINDKIDALVRDRLTVIRDESGKPVFVEGYGADRRVLADKNSKNIISIEIFNISGGE